jgi:hypothetical protein
VSRIEYFLIAYNNKQVFSEHALIEEKSNSKFKIAPLKLLNTVTHFKDPKAAILTSKMTLNGARFRPKSIFFNDRSPCI